MMSLSISSWISGDRNDINARVVAADSGGVVLSVIDSGGGGDGGMG